MFLQSQQWVLLLAAIARNADIAGVDLLYRDNCDTLDIV
jgi:hypothetical protein